MLSNEIIGAIRTLLLRADIKGAEVPAFNKVMCALADAEADNLAKVTPPPPVRKERRLLPEA